jgi:uncharacterized membrane protein
MQHVVRARATPTAPALGDAAAAPARAARKVSALAGGVLLALSLAYPLVVWFTLGHASPRWIALLLVALALGRAWATREAFWLAAAGGATLLAAASAIGNRWGPLQLYPALVNLVMLSLFALSLWKGPSVVERLARLREPDFPPAAVRYTRRVTQAWCIFFVVNGAIAAATALWANPATWALYNGLVAYVAMAALMGGEWLVRRRVRARIAAAEASHG